MPNFKNLITNCLDARLADESALLSALESGKIGDVALESCIIL